MKYQVNDRATYKKRAGTIISLTSYPEVVYFNPDNNKKGNDGMFPVMTTELTPIAARSSHEND